MLREYVHALSCTYICLFVFSSDLLKPHLSSQSYMYVEFDYCHYNQNWIWSHTNCRKLIIDVKFSSLQYTCLVFLVLAAEVICAILAGIFEEKVYIYLFLKYLQIKCDMYCNNLCVITIFPGVLQIEEVTETKMLHQVKYEYNTTNNASAITHMWDTLQLKVS